MFCYVYAQEEDDQCALYTDCESCIGGTNVTHGVICYYCNDLCKTAHFNGLISGDCPLLETYVWSCSYNGLIIVILLSVGSCCVCCICCIPVCVVCLCCIAACSKRRTAVVQTEINQQLLGDNRKERRENRKVNTKLVMEKYGRAV